MCNDIAVWGLSWSLRSLKYLTSTQSLLLHLKKALFIPMTDPHVSKSSSATTRRCLFDNSQFYTARSEENPLV